MAQAPSDPRTIITPDAFEVSPALLGLPLAVPSRRGIASLIDLAVIGVITVVTKDLGVVVGVLVAVVFVYMALRSPISRDLPAPLAWAFRGSVGCLGFVILLITLAIWAVRSAPDMESLVSDDASVNLDGRPVRVRDVLQGVRGGIGLSRAGTVEEAETAATDIATTAFASGLTEPEIRRLLADLVPDDADWSEEADAIIDRAVATARSEGESEEERGPDVTALSAEAALIEYARVLQLDSAETDESERRALRERALPAVASDTLERLTDRVQSLESDQARTRRDLEASQERVQELEQGSGLVRLVRQLVDQLGLAFGWGSIYFAVLLPWWKGQTLGKRLLGVRVLRLDGEPINWWLAFERAGGYAAGVATGLLGFAQVYWDPNRQGIHDKIAGTVVIRDGAPRVPGPWSGPPGSTAAK